MEGGFVVGDVLVDLTFDVRDDFGGHSDFARDPVEVLVNAIQPSLASFTFRYGLLSHCKGGGSVSGFHRHKRSVVGLVS